MGNETEGDRGGSLLTEAQREFLRGKSDHIDPGSAHERAMKSRIRQRLKEGIHDFAILFETDQLTNQDLERVFAPEDDSGPEISSVMAFLYRIAQIVGYTGPADTIRFWVEEGIRRALHRERSPGSHVIRSPEVSVEVNEGEAISLDSINAKLREGNTSDLSDAEMEFMFWLTTRDFTDSNLRDDAVQVINELAARIEEDLDLRGNFILSDPTAYATSNESDDK